MSLQSDMPPKLSGTTAILLVFQVDSTHERIINVYMGLVVHRVDSHLYSPSQINDFIQDIEGDLWVVHNALKAGCNPGKRHAYCLFVDNLSSAMSIPMDPPYCLVYPTSYIKGIEPNHFDTWNSPVGMRLHRCVCRATLQYGNDDPKQRTKYVESHLIMPRGAQYNDHLYPSILEPQNHHSLLIDPVTGEPCLMEVVGNFKATDPIFKGCYGGSLLYLEDDLARLRWQKIPVPPALSYWQYRESVAAKQSPYRGAAPDMSMEPPKTKCSSSKSRPLRDTGHSSNTSTLKHPDSTSKKKPSHSQESTLDHQAKSPQACSSRKHGCSPSPTAVSAGCKQRDLCEVDSGMVNTTLPIGFSTMDTFCSPMGSLSKVIEPLAPSITSTPLGKAGPREGWTISSDSRHSSALLFASSSFNLPGFPSMGLGSLTPSVPSIAGSHHISSTWPPNSFPSRPSTPRLTIDQANNIFGLASECQVLSIKLAKDFQVLSGLEAIHRNSVQGMAHEMLTLGHSAQEATYAAILWDNVMEAECEAMTRCLHSEADATWKKMHEVMYNHQLEYDR